MGQDPILPLVSRGCTTKLPPSTPHRRICDQGHENTKRGVSNEGPLA